MNTRELREHLAVLYHGGDREVRLDYPPDLIVSAVEDGEAVRLLTASDVRRRGAIAPSQAGGYHVTPPHEVVR